MTRHPQFFELCDIINRLLGPDGCPWDREQTLHSLRHSVLEETCELIDAIEHKDSEHMADELGDLFFNVIFFAKVAENAGNFTLDDALKKVCNKIISRHPHVFGDDPQAMKDSAQVLEVWEQLKKKETAHKTRKSSMDGIPDAFSSLLRAQKMVSRMKKAKYPDDARDDALRVALVSEEELGKQLFALVQAAEKQGLNAELALRKVCTAKEHAVREWEEKR